MRRSLTWSAALHLLVLVLAIVGLPRLWESDHVTNTPVIVEMVKIDQLTRAKETPKKASKKKAKKTLPPKAKPPTAALPPPPPRIKERPRPDAEKVPLIKKAKPKKIKKKAKKKKKKKKPKVHAPRPPRAIARARPKRRPLPPKEDFLQSVLRDVAPEERGETPKEKPKKKQPEPPPPEPKKVVRNRAPLDAVATVSEIDAIRRRIEQCWVIPAGARDADKLVVSIRVWVNPDGTVREARILDRSRMSKNVFFRTAAESALRAVLNPRCSPLPIPLKKYDQFKEFVLDFNPREAAGS